MCTRWKVILWFWTSTQRIYPLWTTWDQQNTRTPATVSAFVFQNLSKTWKEVKLSIKKNIQLIKHKTVTAPEWWWIAPVVTQSLVYLGFCFSFWYQSGPSLLVCKWKRQRGKIMVRKVWIQGNILQRALTQPTAMKSSNETKWQKSRLSFPAKPTRSFVWTSVQAGYGGVTHKRVLAKSDTYKHSGLGFAWRLFFCGPVDPFGLLFSCTGGLDTSFIRFQQVQSVSLSGLHADQNLLHHRQLLQDHMVYKNMDMETKVKQ